MKLSNAEIIILKKIIIKNQAKNLPFSAIIDLISNELMLYGFNENDEINNYGLELENIINFINFILTE
jgi:hypothetical protein